MGALRRGPCGWDIDGKGSIRIFILDAKFSVILLIWLGEYGRGGWWWRTITRQALRQRGDGGNIVFKSRVLAGPCAFLVASRFTCRMYIGAAPFGLSPREPHGSSRNRRYTGASGKRHRIPGAGCRACVTSGRGGGSLRVVAEAGGRLPNHPLGGNKPVRIVIRYSSNVRFATFRRVLSGSIATTRTRVSLAFRTRFDTSANPPATALSVNSLPLGSG